jgi:Mrp family chromosome partitioning ATPase/capsular polysaccharide biosynthesis protein
VSNGEIRDDRQNDFDSGVPMAEQVAASVRVLRRHWLVIVLLPLLAIAVSLFLTSRTTKLYDATAKVYIAPTNPVAGTISPGSQQTSADPERDLNTEVSEITETPMANLVRSSLKLSESNVDLLTQVDAELEGTTNIVDVIVSDTDPARAARIANAFATQYSNVYSLDAERSEFQVALNREQADMTALTPAEQAAPAGQQLQTTVNSLKTALATAVPFASVTQVAAVPTSPSSPKPLKDALIALVAGLLVAIAAAIIVELFDRTLRDEEEAAAISRLPILGAIPRTRLQVARLTGFAQLRHWLAAIGGGGSDSRNRRRLSDHLAPDAPAPEFEGEGEGSAATANGAGGSLLSLSAFRDDSSTSESARALGALPERSWELEESYDSLAVALLFRLGPAENVVMVTSAGPRDGKTNVTLGLAAALAKLGQQVIAVECDMRRPRFAEYLGLPAEQEGLSAILDGNRRAGIGLVEVPVDAARGAAGPGAAAAPATDGHAFSVLPCGSIPSSPLPLLGGPDLAPLLRQLQVRADVVLLDTPPVGAIKDAVVLAAYVDQVMLVARVGHTRRDDLRRCRSALVRAGSPLLGIVAVGTARSQVLAYYSRASRSKLAARSDRPALIARTAARPLRVVTSRRSQSELPVPPPRPQAETYSRHDLEYEPPNTDLPAPPPRRHPEPPREPAHQLEPLIAELLAPATQSRSEPPREEPQQREPPGAEPPAPPPDAQSHPEATAEPEPPLPTTEAEARTAEPLAPPSPDAESHPEAGPADEPPSRDAESHPEAGPADAPAGAELPVPPRPHAEPHSEPTPADEATAAEPGLPSLALVETRNGHGHDPTADSEAHAPEEEADSEPKRARDKGRSQEAESEQEAAQKKPAKPRAKRRTAAAAKEERSRRGSGADDAG